MLLPLAAGKTPKFTVAVTAEQATTLGAFFGIGERLGNFAPERQLASKEFALPAGPSTVEIDFDVTMDRAQYGFVVLQTNPLVSAAMSSHRLTGVLSVIHGGSQPANEALGVEKVMYYCPKRRPDGKNLAITCTPPLQPFGVGPLRSGVFRPTANGANAWVAPLDQANPFVRCEWAQPRTVRTIVLWFDTDFDHPMETCLMGHPENVVPFCVRRYTIVDDGGRVVFETSDNRHSRNEIRLTSPLCTTSLTVHMTREHEQVPVSLLGLQVFA